MTYMSYLHLILFCFFFFKQKTAYEMRISDWSSDVCSSDLTVGRCEADHLDIVLPAAAGRQADDALADECITSADGHRREGLRNSALEQIGRASCRERVCQYV